MSSNKWKIWDFFRAHKYSVSEGSEGIVCFQTFDPFITRILKDQISPSHQYHLKMGAEVTVDWLESEIETLDLFGNSDNYVVINAQQLPKESLQYICENSQNFNGRLFVLFFEGENTYWKDLNGKNVGDRFYIEPPMFWETGQLLDFLSQVLYVNLSYQSKNFILEKVEPDCSHFTTVLNSLKINFPDEKEISLEQVKSVLDQERIDIFSLASLFSQKKRSQFFEKLTNEKATFEEMKSIFLFMQGHLIKLYDTSYSKNKKRLSKYDKEIINSSKLWKKDELQKDIHLFSILEMKAKRKESLLTQEIHSLYLKSF